MTDVQSLGNGFSQARERTLSDLVFDGTLSPLSHLTLYGTAALNTSTAHTDAINSGLRLAMGDRLTLDMGQSYIRDQEISGVVTKLSLQATETIRMELLSRYDVHSSTFHENTVRLIYSSCCWEVALRYMYRIQGPGQSPQSDVEVTFDLKIPTQNAPAKPGER